MQISFECIVRGQETVGTAEHEFYFSLPAFQLLRGQGVTLTAPRRPTTSTPSAP